MRRVILTTTVAGLMLVMALLSACSISESDVEPLGALRVSAMDTSLGLTLENGQVLINDVPRAQQMPVVLGRVPGGEVEVTVNPGLLYPARTQIVTINPPDTAEVTFLYSAEDLISTVTVQSDQEDAVIVIDEQVQPDLEVGTAFQIAAGVHSITVYKAGYLNVAPVRITEELIGSEEYTYTFALEEAPVGNQTGDLFPDFTLPDDFGGEQALAQYRGDVVLVTFWFYACGPCREEFPTIENVFEERAVEGFRVLGINVGWYNDNQEDFEAIREELNLTFPLLFNTYGIDWTVTDLLIGTAPTNFILAPNGMIHARRGQLTYESLNDLIDEAMGN